MGNLTAFKKDLEFGEKNEEKVGEMFERLGRKVEPTNTTNILDFKLIDKKGREIWMELKTRRCEKDKYDTTMIGLNKLIEAFKRYDTSGTYTVFIFKFTDGIYYISPFFLLPVFDHKLGRFDRLGFDKKKGYCYYNVKELIKLNEEKNENKI